MTQRWGIPATLFAGQTVAVIGAGPDTTEAFIRENTTGLKTIAVNRAVRHAPWADVFVALDPHHPFWEEADKMGFSGIRICGVECDLDAMYAGMFYERVTLRDGTQLEIRNNALAAIRVAERGGAAKIVLVGFDPARYEEIHAHTGFRGLTEGLEKITTELLAKGIPVERIDSPVQNPGTRPPRRGELVDVATFPQVKRTGRKVAVG